MKPWTTYAAGFAAVASVTLASCGDDDGEVPVANRAPTISAEVTSSGNAADTIFFTEQDQIGSSIGITLTYDDPDGNLSFLTFDRDGVELGAGSTFVREGSATGSLSSNRVLVDATGGTREVFLVASTDFDTSVTFTISAFDDEGLSASTDVTLVTPVQSTPIERTLEGILLNAAGPQGTGGLNLNDGSSTGSADSLADIRDLGIDDAIAVGTENWRRQIAPVNGTVLRRIAADYVTENPFADVEFRQDIIDAFESTSVDIGDASSEVAVDDVFAALAQDEDGNDRYYLLLVRNVITETEEAGSQTRDNGDRYVFDIKY